MPPGWPPKGNQQRDANPDAQAPGASMGAGFGMDFEKMLTDLVSTLPVEQTATLMATIQRWKEIRQQVAESNPWLPSSWITGGAPPGTGNLLYQLTRMNIHIVQTISQFTLDALDDQFRDIRRRRAGQHRRTIEVSGVLGRWARARVAPRLWNDTQSTQTVVLQPRAITDEIGAPVTISSHQNQAQGLAELFAVGLTPPAPSAIAGRNRIDTPIEIPPQGKRAVQVLVHLAEGLFVPENATGDPPTSGLYLADVDVLSASNQQFVVDQLRLRIHVAKHSSYSGVKAAAPGTGDDGIPPVEVPGEEKPAPPRPPRPRPRGDRKRER